MVQKLNSLRWKFTASTKAKANEVNENFTQLLNKDNELIDAIDTIRNFISKLNNREVSIEYYRELNNRSMFKVNGVVDGYAMYLEGLNSKVKPTDIDISYNIGILTELYKIYMGYAIGGKYV